MTDILEIATSAQDGHQKLDQFGLRLVVPFALCNWHLFQSLDQADLDSASKVATDVGGGVARVAKYAIDSQSYTLYIPGRPETDFPLVIGEPFVLILRSGAPASWP